jgi:O-acetyl-ADP-ribose deacetylase
MRIELHFGDITEFNTDCIVNAANSSLLGGGGVDGAIHKKAGKLLKEYCAKLNGCLTGEAKLSPGFNLKANYIIHTVGPRISFNNVEPTFEDCENLKQSYQSCLEIASKEKFNEIVFPNISTGVYGFPIDLASKISLRTVFKFLEKNEYPKKVIFCCFNIENLESYINEIKENYE